MVEKQEVLLLDGRNCKVVLTLAFTAHVLCIQLQLETCSYSELCTLIIPFHTE